MTDIRATDDLLASFAGRSCVGLAVPHIARTLVGPDQRWLLPYSLVLAPTLLLVADIVGRVVARPGEVQAGLVTAFLGAPIFIVQHMDADTSVGALLRALNSSGKLPCMEARHDEKFEAGYIYLAPSDHHLLIKHGKMIVSKGARENRSRPGIDPPRSGSREEL